MSTVEVLEKTPRRAVIQGIPWYVGAALFASTAVVLGIMWDISWHRTIGRDSFWTPAHICIYLGGLVAGLSSAYVVLRSTFRGTDRDRAASVRFWGFTGPLGAWFAIWGALAMITSAPFDDWWHNAYGLDVKILSPPHAVLAAGIFAVQLGAIFYTLALQNRADRKTSRTLDRLYLWTLGVLVLMGAIMVSEAHFISMAHESRYYIRAAWVFPLLFCVAVTSGRTRWPATFTAAVYMIVVIAMMQILQLFPAEPQLGPIYQHVTHMVPPPFPLLLVLPALAIDEMYRRFSKRANVWLMAGLLGTAFFIIFFVVQWIFAYLLQSPIANNRFFAGDSFSYFIPSDAPAVRREFYTESASSLRLGLVLAFVISIVTSCVGLAFGRWMSTVKR